MTEKSKIKIYNDVLLKKLSVYLNIEPCHIKPELIETVCEQCALETEEAYSYVLASAMFFDVAGKEDDRELFELYFPYMIRELDNDEYESDPYMLEVFLPECKEEEWEIKGCRYAPCEAFVRDDFLYMPDGRVIAQIGFFMREYAYPCVFQGGREWMLITPNEINTMKKPINKARGKVLTFGLGLGYFAFMAARKDEVESVTVVERDKSVITLFEKYILPQMSCKDKIRIVCADAFEYAEMEMKDGGFDFVFADIWHDPSDGVQAYKRLKACEHNLPDAEFAYWIEDTLKYYL